MIFKESGYTPKNLRDFIEFKKWTQKEAAVFFGVSEKTIRNWVAETDSPSHRIMPVDKWRLTYAALPSVKRDI